MNLLGNLPTTKRTKKLNICKKVSNSDNNQLYEIFYGEDNDNTFHGFEISYTLQEIFDKTLFEDTFHGFEISHA